jgi:quercetin dioxygenase-like cupin family protein
MSATFIPDIAAAVEIPADGILSRTVFRDGVRAVVFAFDTDQELSEHTAAVPAVIQVLRGRIALTLGADDAVEAGPGSWAHLPPRLPHSLVATEPSVVLLTLLREE